jgi:hypothetical protein
MMTVIAGRKRERLVRFLRAPDSAHERKLVEMREQAKELRQRVDVVWRLLLQSAATMGNSRGWKGLFGDSGDSMLSRLMAFDAVGAIRQDLRVSYMEPILQTASVRMPRHKAETLAKNHTRISDLGGQAAARKTAFDQPTREAKIAFMKGFHGIGDKYARNVWMDLYDDQFHDAIAFDERLEKIAAAMGARFQGYAAAERYFVELAAESGREPWEVDRLLYHFNDDAIDAIAAPG